MARARLGLQERGAWKAPALDLLILAWLIWLFDAINNLAPVRQGLAQHNGVRILDLERSLHLDPEHTLNAWLAKHTLFSHLVVFWYENVHIAVTVAVLGWLSWRRPERTGAMRATLVIVNLLALAVFWSFPVAPARMLPGGYIDLVALVHHVPVWRIGARALDSNQLCSMPSLHIAWAVWCSMVLWRISTRRWLRVLMVIYPFVTAYAVMATANHYLADVVLAAALTPAVALILERGVLRARLGPRPRS